MAGLARQEAPRLQLLETAQSPIASIEAEATLLGALILDPAAWVRVEGIIAAPHFYNSGHRDIFREIEALHREGKAPDLTLLVSRLADRGQLDAVGGRRAIAQLVDGVISTANVDQYAQLIREKWTRRQLMLLAGEMQRLAQESNSPEAIATIRTELDRLTGISADDWTTMDQLREQLIVECSAIMDGRPSAAIPTGFYDLDSKLSGGLEPGTITLIGGRPSMGKSAFALAIAAQMASTAPVGFYSMEMSSLSLARRLAASASGILGGAIKTMRLNESATSQLFESILAMAQGKQLFLRFRQPSLEVLCNDIQSAIARYGLKVIVIDHLHLMAGSEDTAELARISNRLANLCRATGVVMISLCQLSRGVESRTNKRPTMGDLRQSGALEQDADNVVFLYRDEYYNPESSDRGIVEVILAKQRDGPIGTVKLLFEPHFSRFRSLAHL